MTKEERMPVNDVEIRFKNIEERITDLLNIANKLSEEKIKEEFCEIWKLLQEVIYDINYSISNLDNTTKQKYLEKILNLSIEFSQKILKKVTDKRLRHLVIHVFLDWIINEAIRWDIELPKIEIPEPKLPTYTKRYLHKENLCLSPFNFKELLSTKINTIDEMASIINTIDEMDEMALINKGVLHLILWSREIQKREYTQLAITPYKNYRLAITPYKNYNIKAEEFKTFTFKEKIKSLESFYYLLER